MALPSLDSVPTAYLKKSEDNKPLEVPDVMLKWFSNMVDTLNEALIEINNRLVAGGL